MHQSPQPIIKREWSRLPHPLIATAYFFWQRTLDITVALLGLLLLISISPIIWLANQLCSPGPLFYRQVRLGIAQQPFTMFKLRSMIQTAESDGARWTAKNDKRVTRIGQYLRKSHLDELPQCWNILKGEMSLIGPRPERPEFVALLLKEIPHYQLRYRVKPGLTGWAQVNYGYGDSVEDARIKLKYDLMYITNQSWQLDLTILRRTFAVTLKGR